MQLTHLLPIKRWNDLEADLENKARQTKKAIYKKLDWHNGTKRQH